MRRVDDLVADADRVHPELDVDEGVALRLGQQPARVGARCCVQRMWISRRSRAARPASSSRFGPSRLAGHLGVVVALVEALARGPRPPAATTRGDGWGHRPDPRFSLGGALISAWRRATDILQAPNPVCHKDLESLLRRGSSVGQSTALVKRGSRVRIPSPASSRLIVEAALETPALAVAALVALCLALRRRPGSGVRGDRLVAGEGRGHAIRLLWAEPLGDRVQLLPGIRVLRRAQRPGQHQGDEELADQRRPPAAERGLLARDQRGQAGARRARRYRRVIRRYVRRLHRAGLYVVLDIHLAGAGRSPRQPDPAACPTPTTRPTSGARSPPTSGTTTGCSSTSTTSPLRRLVVLAARLPGPGLHPGARAGRLLPGGRDAGAGRRGALHRRRASR